MIITFHIVIDALDGDVNNAVKPNRICTVKPIAADDSVAHYNNSCKKNSPPFKTRLNKAAIIILPLTTILFNVIYFSLQI